jgi:hypothetical protein
MVVTISRTDLARRTREVMEQVRSGHTVIVHSYGGDQIVLMDMLDYHLLRAYAAYTSASQPEGLPDEIWQTLQAYLRGDISVSRAAEMFGVSRFDLMDRFKRSGIPLRLGPDSIEEAHEEVATARQTRL